MRYPRRPWLPLLLLITLAGPASAAAECDLQPLPAVAGSPLSFWTTESNAPLIERRRAAEAALTADPAATLRAVVLDKAARPSPGHRRLHKSWRELFPGAAVAVPALLRLLECEAAQTREAAVQVLGWIGPEAAEAVPVLVTLLRDEDSGVRMQTAFTLDNLDAVGDDVLVGLAANLADEAHLVANAAATALAHAWPASRTLLREALSGPSARSAYYAMRGLGRIDELDDVFVPLLVRRAQTGPAWVRNRALQTLYRLDPARVAPYHERLLPLIDVEKVRCDAVRLLAGRTDPAHDAAMLSVAVQALLQYEPSPRRDACHDKIHQDLPRMGEAIVEPLSFLLRQPEIATRRNALIALTELDPRPASVERLLLQAMEDADLRSLAAARVAGSEDAGALKTLARALAHDDAAVRAEAARAAGGMGERGRGLVPLLVERLPGETGASRTAFVVALSRIGGEDARAAIPELRAALAEPETHAAAASALARIAGPEAADVAADLVAALPDQSQGMCPHPTAPDDLRAIGPAAAPALVAALGDADYRPKLALLTILAEWGDDALLPALPTLRGWLDGGEYLALVAAEHLERLGRLEPDDAVRAFGQAFQSANDWNRVRGAAGLARLGGIPCLQAQPVLRSLSGHEYERLSAQARTAYEKGCDGNPPPPLPPGPDDQG